VGRESAGKVERNLEPRKTPVSSRRALVLFYANNPATRYLMLSRATRVSIAALSFLALGCSSTDPSKLSDPATETFAASLGVDISKMTKVSDQLFYQDIVVGTGAAATSTSTITTTYTGWLTNGAQFDSNVGGAPLGPFPLGQHAVIDGWDQGIPGMKVGGKRKLVIGSSLGYGAAGNGPIPPNATLVFDVQLVSSK
jgi:FKBP-type peptidyl-prolyl cis-trans isomerase FkpA